MMHGQNHIKIEIVIIITCITYVCRIM